MADTSSQYLRNAVLTAPPEQLQLMLFDGAIRFASQACDALRRRRFDESCELLLKAQRVVNGLENGLRPEAEPELCARLAALYQFVYRRLVEANLHRDPGAIDDALRILRHQRDTWQLLIDRRSAPTSPEPVAGGPEPGHSPISIQC
jgi:flagellar protein FliS